LASNKPSAAHVRLEELESAFAALAHEQRRHILLTLRFRGGEMSAGAIADRFACSWPTTTRHLRVLESARLVVVEKRGRERIYKLNTAHLQRVVGDWLAVFS
jgi:DNA-binding transcriptional ArsR family regulator